jgi:hypothetical protein
MHHALTNIQTVDGKINNEHRGISTGKKNTGIKFVKLTKWIL